MAKGTKANNSHLNATGETSNLPVKETKSSSIGRPSKFSPENAASICDKISTSTKSIRKICSELNIAVSTVMLWLDNNKEFSEQYARAKEAQADILADEILEIADDSSQDLDHIDEYGNRIENKEFVNRSKLRVEARKWVASKLKPKKYGDKVDIQGSLTIQPITGMEIV